MQTALDEIESFFRTSGIVFNLQRILRNNESFHLLFNNLMALIKFTISYFNINTNSFYY